MQLPLDCESKLPVRHKELAAQTEDRGEPGLRLRV